MKLDTQHGVLTHCMGGWRALFCVLDNLAPHRELPKEPDDPADMSPPLEGRRGFGWVCWLHDWAGHVGYSREGEELARKHMLTREYWATEHELYCPEDTA